MQKSIKDNGFWSWKVRDLDTGMDIPGVIFADDETGEYDQRVRDESGRVMRDDSGEVITARKHGRIKLHYVPISCCQ